MRAQRATELGASAAAAAPARDSVAERAGSSQKRAWVAHLNLMRACCSSACPPDFSLTLDVPRDDNDANR